MRQRFYFLYVHSKLYYGIQCRKHFLRQCKWPAQYYTVEKKPPNIYPTEKRKKKKRKSCFFFYYSMAHPLKPQTHPAASLKYTFHSVASVVMGSTNKCERFHVLYALLQLGCWFSVVKTSRSVCQRLSWWQRGEQQRREEKEKARKGGEVQWEVKNPLYTQTAWLSIRNCKSFPLLFLLFFYLLALLKQN